MDTWFCPFGVRIKEVWLYFITNLSKILFSLLHTLRSADKTHTIIVNATEGIEGYKKKGYVSTYELGLWLLKIWIQGLKGQGM